MKYCLVLCLSLVAAAQDPRAVMQASIARQLAAVEAQRIAVRDQTVAASFFTTIVPPQPVCEPVPQSRIQPVIDRAARREGLTPELLRAVIAKESAWRPCALSHKGAQGLMQLMPETAAMVGVANPFDPAENVSGGARFLRYLLGKYGGDLTLALAAYNSGPSRVDAAGGVPLIPETADYVSWILNRITPRPPQNPL